MVKSTVNKLEDGGWDVSFENGGRAILSADDAKNKEEAVEVASKRLRNSGRVGAAAATPETPADTPRETRKTSKKSK